MMWNKKLIFIGAVSLLFVGCGGAVPTQPGSAVIATTAAVTTSPVVTSGCPAGTISIFGGYCASDLKSACAAAAGVLLTQGGTQYCKVEMNPVTASTPVLFQGFSYLPRLTQNDSSMAWTTNVLLKKGDTLTLSDTGSWGTKTNYILGGFFALSSCSAVDFDGNKDGAVQTNEGNPMGMMASDGTETFFVGTSIKKIINNDGMLRFGINVPSISAGGCITGHITTIKILRCVDSSGNSLSCP